ncbi:MAG: hypothetical protein WBA07_11605 [Rivularia sp. (in: cyanobacteria)]
MLSTSGLMILPLHHGGWTPLVKVWWQEDTLLGKVVGISGFMPFKGDEFADEPAPFGFMNSVPIEEFEEIPLFDNLEAEHTNNFLMWSAFPVNFYYFITISDSRAFWDIKPPGYGLYDKKEGIILISPQKNCILLRGNRKLYKRLQELYENWLQLGKPSPFDYDIEFKQSSKVAASSKDGWNIKRKFYNQFLSL